MGLSQQISCDICSKVKGEANHWFMFNARSRDITFEPWDKSVFEHKSHACSEACCVTALSRTLSSWGQTENAKRNIRLVAG